MIKAAIIGASGYIGFELFKLLEKHPEVKIAALNSEHNAGSKVKDIYPEYKGNAKYTNLSIEQLNNAADIVFLATSDGTAKEIAPKLKIRIIDLSADHRLTAIYGLSELNKTEIKTAKLVANPGCYATAALLSLLPLRENKIVKYIIIDGKSGCSGAGKTPNDRNSAEKLKNNVVAYALSQHKHVAEMEKISGMKISFTPHVLSHFRGLLCTTHILLSKSTSNDEIKKIYKEYYKNAEFVKIMDAIPTLHDVQNTNYCAIGGFEIDKNNRLVIISAIDNMLKGASSQAVQNMNLMFGLKETEGLK
ncbi:N-acetyl-gamma-glutamyl-phosphate reductase [Candidatus Woesearchaeota archaeon]|nr:N-acetyl-gamma-glutamyl-phosphate reductase [Candidatus Woesearchaeota archaeon]